MGVRQLRQKARGSDGDPACSLFKCNYCYTTLSTSYILTSRPVARPVAVAPPEGFMGAILGNSSYTRHAEINCRDQEHQPCAARARRRSAAVVDSGSSTSAAPLEFART